MVQTVFKFMISGDVEIVKMLKELGADVRLETNFGFTALHYAVKKCNFMIFRRLNSN